MRPIDTDSARGDAIRRASPKSRAAYYRAIERRNQRERMAAVGTPIDQRLRRWMDANELNAKEVAGLWGYGVDMVWRTLRGGPLHRSTRKDLEDLLSLPTGADS